MWNDGGFNGDPRQPIGQARPAPSQQGGSDDLRNRLVRQIMGQQPTNIMGGIGQLIAGGGQGLADYMNRPQNQFPTAPGASGSPPTMQGMDFGSLFNFNRGGLY